MHGFTIVLVESNVSEGQAAWEAGKMLNKLVPGRIDYGKVGARWEGVLTGQTDTGVRTGFDDPDFAGRNVVKVKEIPSRITAPTAVVLPDGSIEMHIEYVNQYGISLCDEKWDDRLSEIRKSYPDYWAVGADIRF